MLTAECDVTGEQVWPTPSREHLKSWDHLRPGGQRDCRGKCPLCGMILVPKRGERVTHHFAHPAKSSCLAAYESEDHRRAKMGILDAVNSITGFEAWPEKQIGSSRPDVLLRLGTTTVAVEVQRSTISLAEIRRRTAAYAELAIPVVWLVCLSDLTITPQVESYQDWNGADFVRRTHRYMRARTTEQERFLHALHFGRLYAYLGLDYVLPIHLEVETKYVDTDEVPDGVRASNPEIPEGGYTQRYKSFRIVKPGPPVRLTSFRAQSREPFKSLPAGVIWMDCLERWWSNPQST